MILIHDRMEKKNVNKIKFRSETDKFIYLFNKKNYLRPLRILLLATVIIESPIL